MGRSPHGGGPDPPSAASRSFDEHPRQRLAGAGTCRCIEPAEAIAMNLPRVRCGQGAQRREAPSGDGQGVYRSATESVQKSSGTVIHVQVLPGALSRRTRCRSAILGVF